MPQRVVIDMERPYGIGAEEFGDNEVKSSHDECQTCLPSRFSVHRRLGAPAAEAENELADADVLDLRSMEAGIELTTWFKHEARRVYAMLDESPTDALRRRLIAFLERHGLPATARDIQANCSWLKEPGTAEAALEDLARSGVGTWIPSPEGSPGRPTRRFRLAG